MAKQAKVAVLMRIKEAGKRPYVKPVWNGNKLKPLVGIIRGQEAYRPDATYYLRFTQGGKNRLEPAGHDPVEVLTFRERRRAILTAQAAGLDIAPAGAGPETVGRVTIQAAIDAYLDRMRRDKRHEPTIRSKTFELGQFAQFCKRRYMDELTHDDCIDFREHLRAKKLHDTTIYNKLITLTTCLKQNPLYPVRGLLKFPDDYPTKKDTDPDPYTAEEIALLRKHADPREKLILAFFLATGCREQEIAHVEFSDLNPNTRVVRIQKKPHFNWKPKTDAGTRNIPVSPALMAKLRATAAGNRLLFPSASGGIEKHFLRMFKGLGKRAGVTNIKCHRFRDTFATEQVRRAKNMRELLTVAARLGHSDLETIKVYAKLVEDTSKAAQESAEHMDSFGGDPDEVLAAK
jgi:integrase